MALHRLLGIDLGVPDPATLDDFYREIGFVGEKGSWGPESAPGQIVIEEAPYRQLLEMRVACEGEEDLAEIAGRLEGLGIASEQSEGRLTVPDPVNKWRVVVEPCAVMDIPEVPPRPISAPAGRASRAGAPRVHRRSRRPGPVRDRHPSPTGIAPGNRGGLRKERAGAGSARRRPAPGSARSGPGPGAG